MMKENNIDKLFKAKASEGDFTFKEAHWAAAEKMLDGQPKGGGFRFGLMSGLVIVTVSLVASLTWMNREEDTMHNDIQTTVHTTPYQPDLHDPVDRTEPVHAQPQQTHGTSLQHRAPRSHMRRNKRRHFALLLSMNLQQPRPRQTGKVIGG